LAPDGSLLGVITVAHAAHGFCGKSLIRSRVWQPEQWPDCTGLASLGAALADQIGGLEKEATEAIIAEGIAKRLY